MLDLAIYYGAEIHFANDVLKTGRKDSPTFIDTRLRWLNSAWETPYKEIQRWPLGPFTHLGVITGGGPYRAPSAWRKYERGVRDDYYGCCHMQTGTVPGSQAPPLLGMSKKQPKKRFQISEKDWYTLCQKICNNVDKRIALYGRVIVWS